MTKYGESVEDHFADYDVDPGDIGASSSTMMETTKGTADDKPASVDPK